MLQWSLPLTNICFDRFLTVFAIFSTDGQRDIHIYRSSDSELKHVTDEPTDELTDRPTDGWSDMVTT